MIEKDGLKLISQCKIDNNDVSHIQVLSQHADGTRTTEGPGSVLRRVVSLNQSYKSWVTHT